MVCPEEKIFFIHLPKCGGSAVEMFLLDRFNYNIEACNILCAHFSKINVDRGWTIQNVVHLPYQKQKKICHSGKIYIDDSWLKFTIVRNPYNRISSELAWQISFPTSRNLYYLRTHKEKQYMFNVDQNRFFREDPLHNNWFNHKLPMSKLLDFGKEENVKIHKYEEGLDNIIKQYFDVPSNFKLKRINDPQVDNGISEKIDYRTLWTKSFIENCNTFYKEDFERFGYEMLNPNDYPEF